MTTRERVRAVLRKYVDHDSRIPWTAEFEDALLACLPQPSREGLEKILELPHKFCLHKGCKTENCSDWRELVDAIMDWSNGQEVRWCADIWKGDGRWQFKDCGYGTVCPICAKPRPTEPG